MLKVCNFFLYGIFVLILSSKTFSAEEEPRYEMILRLRDHRPYELGTVGRCPGMAVMVELRRKFEDPAENRTRYVYDNPENPGYIWAATAWYTGRGTINELTRGVDAKLNVRYIFRQNHFERWRDEREADPEENRRIEEFEGETVAEPESGLIYNYFPHREMVADEETFTHKNWLKNSYLEWARDINLTSSQASIRGYITFLRMLLGDSPKYSFTGVDYPNCTVFAIKLARELGFFNEFDINRSYHNVRMQNIGRGAQGFLRTAIDPREWDWSWKGIAIKGVLVGGGVAVGVFAGPALLAWAGGTAASGAIGGTTVAGATAVAAESTAALTVAGTAAMTAAEGTAAVAATTATGTGASLLSLGGGGAAVGGVIGVGVEGASGARKGAYAIAPWDVINNIIRWTRNQWPDAARGEDFREPRIIRYRLTEHGDLQDMPLPDRTRIDMALITGQEERKRIEYVL